MLGLNFPTRVIGYCVQLLELLIMTGSAMDAMFLSCSLSIGSQTITLQNRIVSWKLSLAKTCLLSYCL